MAIHIRPLLLSLCALSILSGCGLVGSPAPTPTVAPTATPGATATPLASTSTPPPATAVAVAPTKPQVTSTRVIPTPTAARTPTRAPGATATPRPAATAAHSAAPATPTPGPARTATATTTINITNLTPTPESTVTAGAETIIAANINSSRPIGPITVYLDGQRIDVEIMGPDVNRLALFTGRILSAGTHEVRVVVVGEGGSSVETKWSFDAVPGPTPTPVR